MAVWGSGGEHEFEKRVSVESIRMMGGCDGRGRAGGVGEYSG